MSVKTSSSRSAWFFLQYRVAPLVVLLYQAVALMVFAITPFLAAGWLRLPFIGAFTEHTLAFNTAQPTTPGAWLFSKAELGRSQIVSAAGEPVANTSQLEQALSRHVEGDTIEIAVKAPEGEVKTLPITLQSLPTTDRITYLYIPYFVGLIYLVSGLWVLGLRRRDASGLAFAMFTASVAIAVAALFDTYTTHRLTTLWTLALSLAGGALFGLAFLFPHEERFVSQYPFLRWMGYIPSLALFALAIPTLFNYAHPTAYINAWIAEYAYTGLALLFFLGWTTVRLFKSPSPITREQSRFTLLGSVIAFAPIGIWFALITFFPKVSFSSFLLLPLGVFPIVTAYTILRYRLLRTDYLLSRAALYGLLTVLAVGGYGLLVTGLTYVLVSVLRAEKTIAIGIITFVLAILLLPLRGHLQRLVDAFFSRGQAAYRERLQAFGRELTRALELPIILGLLRQYVQQNISPTQAHIFVHDPLSDHYVATADGSDHGRPTSDLCFSVNSPLAHLLASQRASLYLGQTATLPPALKPEQTRLALLASQLFIPLPGRQRLAGWLALGPRRSGEPYTVRDLEFLESLCDQAALAVERAQVVGDLERRVREMNVLTRVSQGINVTLAFDDILELIYAQTTQVIHSQDFRITLKDSFSEILYHVFYLENDDRLTERENRPLPIGQGLEHELVRSRRPLVTDDYERECRSRGVLPSFQGVFAWAGVPLNTSAETIGAIGLGSRDPSVIYTDDQVSLLQAIADQAAGAIVKARLLQESERRTRQLTTLNEVARSLTSTLDLGPLLSQILNSAVGILNCEAGSLLLVDPQTDELVFEVVVGPPESQNLLGQRLPPGTGLVGKAVDTRQAIIANDVRRTKEWFDKPDEQTGFTTKDLLVVPMQVKDRITGVIEVINRRDGLPFSPDDQELLAAFTSQAAVAIENARLYTQTDQTLAARVEELSVMQRIDRELNASLDVSRAMRITLEWALRQSRAEAGLVGVVEKESGATQLRLGAEHRLQVMASQGYTSELAAYRDRPMPVTLPALRQAVESGQPQCVYAAEAAPGFALMSGAQRQAVIPIRREAQVIGVILLESLQADVYPEETLAFLSRLSDHAAIAIANARLYDEVMEANLAKSKFVSFVAHELKNPMASIKGYTELVAGGMAGPVNEMQSSFLSTVRTNVDRMNTIISDLNDLTKIEVGGMRLDFKTVKVNEVVEEVVRSFSRQVEEKEQRLVINLPASLPMVWADQLRLSQILTNLVSNAHKYTPQGGQITIGADVMAASAALESSAVLETRAALEISTGEPGSMEVVHLWVEDTGIGISPEDQKQVFTQYFRTEESKEMASGTGLGLNITKSLVEMQGGHIWFESEPGKGTTFHFTVPVVEAA